MSRSTDAGEHSGLVRRLRRSCALLSDEAATAIEALRDVIATRSQQLADVSHERDLARREVAEVLDTVEGEYLDGDGDTTGPESRAVANAFTLVRERLGLQDPDEMEEVPRG